MTTASANHGQVRSGNVDGIRAADQFSDRVTLSQRGRVTLVRLSQPEKRNAIDGKMVEAIRSAFDGLPKETCAVVLHGEGGHFCAGADLGELAKYSGLDVARFSRSVHEVLDRIEYGAVPVIAALHGGVIGGGLELAAQGMLHRQSRMLRRQFRLRAHLRLRCPLPTTLRPRWHISHPGDAEAQARGVPPMLRGTGGHLVRRGRCR